MPKLSHRAISLLLIGMFATGTLAGASMANMELPSDQPRTDLAQSVPMVRAVTLDDALNQCQQFTGQEVEDCSDAAMQSWCVDAPEAIPNALCTTSPTEQQAKELALKQMDEAAYGNCRTNISPTFGICATYVDDTLYYVTFTDGNPTTVTR